MILDVDRMRSCLWFCLFWLEVMLYSVLFLHFLECKDFQIFMWNFPCKNNVQLNDYLPLSFVLVLATQFGAISTYSFSLYVLALDSLCQIFPYLWQFQLESFLRFVSLFVTESLKFALSTPRNNLQISR